MEKTLLKDNILLKNGRIIDPASQTNEAGDILIRDGILHSIGGSFSKPSPGVETIDLDGQWVMPGFIDSYASVGEPGREDIETLQEGAWRAVSGGFTALFILPCSDPPLDNQALVKFVLSEGKISPIHIYPIGAATKNCSGDELSEMNELKKAGCVAFSEGRKPIENSLIMRRALEYSSMVGSSILAFPDDADLSNAGFANEGFTATTLGFRPTPAASEEIAVTRDLILTQLTNGQIQIGPISSRGSIKKIQNAKQEIKQTQSDAKVYAFTAPHYLFLNEEIMNTILAEGKVFPPFRTEQDRLDMIQACVQEDIDFLVSDHTPHLPYEVNQELLYAPFGISSLEIAVALAVESLHFQAKADPMLIARLFSFNVAQAYNLPLGKLTEGMEANITIIDPNHKKTINRETFLSRAYNSPFMDYELRGFPSYTIARGVLRMKNGTVLAS